jgi:hypothetical protein
VRGGPVRVRRQGLLEALPGRLGVARLQLQEAEVVEGGGVAGLGAQQVEVGRARRRQVALEMEADGGVAGGAGGILRAGGGPRGGRLGRGRGGGGHAISLIRLLSIEPTSMSGLRKVTSSSATSNSFPCS